MSAEPQDPATGEADLDGIGYAEAVAELDEILAELDSDHVDVDRLAEQVKRAADLVQLCRRRIDSARVEITRIVADLEALDDAAADASGDATAGDGDTASDTPGDGLFDPDI